MVSFIDIISKVGGLSTSLLAGMGLIGGLYNSYVYAIHFVHLLYFVREIDLDDNFKDDNDL